MSHRVRDDFGSESGASSLFVRYHFSGSRFRRLTISGRVVRRRMGERGYLFFAARVRDVFRDDFRDGTFAPFLRASLSPMAIACLRLVTFRPDPLFSVPFFLRRMVDLTFFAADCPYLATITSDVILCKARADVVKPRFGAVQRWLQSAGSGRLAMAHPCEQHLDHYWQFQGQSMARLSVTSSCFAVTHLRVCVPAWRMCPDSIASRESRACPHRAWQCIACAR